MTEGADRQTRAPATPHAVRFYGFKSAKGVWGKTRVFPHSLLQIFCRFDFFDKLRAALPGSPIFIYAISLSHSQPAVNQRNKLAVGISRGSIESAALYRAHRIRYCIVA